MPTPRKKRPGISAAVVAAACATIAGWMRIVGQVTAVPTRSRVVARAMRAEDAPDEGALPLPVDPGMEVVGDEREAEAAACSAITA